MDWISGFQQRLAAARETGVVRAVSASTAAVAVPRKRIDARAIADALARSAGLNSLDHGWFPLAPEKARAALIAPLERDLAYGARCMSLPDAAAFADEFLRRLGPDAEFLTNATYPTAEQQQTTFWRGSWNPLTRATFDAGVFGVGNGEALLLWVEDED